MSDEQAPEIQINVKGPSELKLQISITTDKTVLELKQAIAAKSDVEADRQRLIYSGRVLKDDDLLSVYKIQSSHTIHMVKGVSRSGGTSSSSSSGPAPQQLPTMQTGQNVHDPLTQLNGHMGFGAMAGLNPFGEMGLNQNDPNMMQSMLNSPQFLQQMSSMLSNPAVIDQVIASNPQLSAMGPQVRQAFQDEGFRQMISNPESFQQMLRMASMFQGAGGGGGFGSPFGAPPPSFPAPGTPNPNPNATPANPSSTPTSPPSTTAPAANPFNLFAGLGGAPGAGAGGGAFGDANPFGANPALMQQMFGLGSPYGPGAGGLGGYGGAATTPAAPADTRPPEERFQVQLQQLQDMGFTNAQQNVRALLATGGNVQGAIDYIFSGGGI
ncbi:hypothetical protein CVT25_013589 [Psilocybe cyanescens]|uniref:Uncharacterized protein n=1 Tax=Psilocybe cyanescens TaxID=93625 RepID=A0A409WSW2_PSICY|nr:hypothetical protein CVT25_013589 [Psilocybe cyanescens]